MPTSTTARSASSSSSPDPSPTSALHPRMPLTAANAADCATAVEAKGGHGSVVAEQPRVVLESLHRRLDLALGLDPPHPGRALDALARLEVLVDLEEVLDL